MTKGRDKTATGESNENRQSGDYQGQDFELALGMHILLKLIRDHKEKFSICCQFSPAEKFDDVVIKVRLNSQTVDTYFCVQAKHEKIKEIEPQSTLTDQAFSREQNEFSLLMYARGYVKMKEHSVFQESIIGGLILATNRRLEASNIFEKVEKNKIMIDLGPNTKLYQIQETARAGSASELLKFLRKGDPNMSAIPMSDEDKIVTHIKEFAERFYLAVNLPNEKELEDEVKKQLELCENPQFNAPEAKLAFAEFKNQLNSTRKVGTITFIGVEMLQKIKQELVASSLKQTGMVEDILKSKVRFQPHSYENIVSGFKHIFPKQSSVQLVHLIFDPVECEEIVKKIVKSLKECGFREKSDTKFQNLFFSVSSDKTRYVLLFVSTSIDATKSRKEGSEIYGKLNMFLNKYKNGKVIVVVTSTEISVALTSLIEKTKPQCLIETWQESKISDGTSFQEFLNSPIKVESSVETVHQKILHFETKEMELSVIRLEQALQEMETSHRAKGSYFFETITGLLGRPSEICTSFTSSEGLHLLVLFWNESTTTEDPNLAPIIGRLVLTMTKNPNKQFAFVTTKKLFSEVKSVIGKLHKVICDKTDSSDDITFWPKLMNEYEELEESGKLWFDGLLKEPLSKLEIVTIEKVKGAAALTPDSLTDVLKTNVIFQGQEHSLHNFLDESSAKKVLTGEALTQLIRQEVIYIGNNCPHLSDLESARYKTRIEISHDQLFSILTRNKIDYFVFPGVSLQELEAFNPNSHLGAVVTWKEINNSSTFPHLILLERNDHETKFKSLCQRFHRAFELEVNDQRECEPISIYLIIRNQSGFVLAETYSPQFYIPRRFLPVTVDISKIKQIILDENGRDYFVFSGTDENLLLKLMKFDSNTKKLEAAKRLKVHEDEADASEAYRNLTLDQKTKEFSIHLFHIETSLLTSTVYWHRTHGDVSRLKTTRIEGNGEPLKEEHFVVCLDNSVVIVADDPGMGKSTTLSRIGERIKFNKPLIWTFKIDLNEHQTLINSYKDELTMATFLKLMSGVDETLKEPLPRFLFQYLLTKDHKIFFLFDGFDEVKSEFQRVVLELLKFVARETRSMCCITTRRHDQAKLENNLSVLAHSFVPLTEEEPINFLGQFWWSTIKLVSAGTNEPLILKKCAEDCVRQFERSIHDRYKSFISIPLRVRMLAEVFRSQVVSALTNTNLDTSNSNCFDVGSNAFSLSDLYEKFIELKYDIYFNEKVAIEEGLDSNWKTIARSICTASYSRLALKELFGNDSMDLAGVDDKRYQLDTNSLLRIGLIQGSELSQTFVHKTFSEYFVAAKLVQILRYLSSTVISPSFKITWCTLLLSKLFTKSWSVIRAFMNDHLTIPCLFDEASELIPHWREEMNSRLILQKHIFVVIRENLVGLLKLLLDNTHDQSIIERCVNISGHTESMPLHDAAKFASRKLVEMLIEKGADIKAKTSNGVTPLHAAADSGNFEVVEILIQKGADINAKSTKGVTPLHKAAAQRGNHTQRGNHEIVEMLIEKGADINAKNSKGVTPLYTAAGRGRHKIVEILIEKGADINAKTSDGDTPLHRAFVQRGNHEIGKMLIEKGTDINAENSKGVTPLYRSKHKIVEILIQKGADINAKNSKGVTPLHRAADSGDLEIVKMLIEKGAEIKVHKSDGDTVSLTPPIRRADSLFFQNSSM